ncbi:MAG: hypothetical protein HZC40_16010 [Chloroflexi bacterium]|nr:hypothetical protein [Chloroflexota bacterium]
MMNPIAFGMIVLGLCLLLFGIFLTLTHKPRGIAISFAGLIAIAIPFATSFLLGANP